FGRPSRREPAQGPAEHARRAPSDARSAGSEPHRPALGGASTAPSPGPRRPELSRSSSRHRGALPLEAGRAHRGRARHVECEREPPMAEARVATLHPLAGYADETPTDSERKTLPPVIAHVL